MTYPMCRIRSIVNQWFGIGPSLLLTPLLAVRQPFSAHIRSGKTRMLIVVIIVIVLISVTAMIVILPAPKASPVSLIPISSSPCIANGTTKLGGDMSMFQLNCALRNEGGATLNADPHYFSLTDSFGAVWDSSFFANLYPTMDIPGGGSLDITIGFAIWPGAHPVTLVFDDGSGNSGRADFSDLWGAPTVRLATNFYLSDLRGEMVLRSIGNFSPDPGKWFLNTSIKITNNVETVMPLDKLDFTLNSWDGIDYKADLRFGNDFPVGLQPGTSITVEITFDMYVGSGIRSLTYNDHFSQMTVYDNVEPVHNKVTY